MSSRIHPQARTAPKIRQEIKESGLSDARPPKSSYHSCHGCQMAQAGPITRPFAPGPYAAYHAERDEDDVIPKAEGEMISAKKTFKDHEPGIVHVDIKCLPQMPDETSRRYLFVAIDRATRWVFLHIYGDMTDKSSVDFLRRLKLASPIKIIKLLTDNCSQFTDRFTTKDRKPSGEHAFDKVCAAMGIEHRLAPPGIRKLMVWSNDSTAVSANYCNRPDSTAGPIWRRPCSTI